LFLFDALATSGRDMGSVETFDPLAAESAARWAGLEISPDTVASAVSLQLQQASLRHAPWIANEATPAEFSLNRRGARLAPRPRLPSTTPNCATRLNVRPRQQRRDGHNAEELCCSDAGWMLVGCGSLA
jgi:hypothetical protein